MSSNRLRSSSWSEEIEAEKALLFNKSELSDVIVYVADIPDPVSFAKTEHAPEIAQYILQYKRLQKRNLCFFFHKDVLSRRSVFFRQLFNGLCELEYGIQIVKTDSFDCDLQHTQLRLKWDAESVEIVFFYLYSGKLDFLARIRKFEQIYGFQYDLYSSPVHQYYFRFILPQLIEMCDAFKLKDLSQYLYRKFCPTAKAPGDFVMPTSTEHQFFNSVSVHTGDVLHENLSGVSLASCSTYFYSVLSGTWKDSSSKVIQITGIEPEVFQKVVAFISMEREIELGSFENILKLLHSAFYLGVGSLIGFCSHVLRIKFLSPQTVCLIWNISSLHTETVALSKQCKELFQNRFIECSLSSGFLQLDEVLLKSALDCGKIHAKSLEMMQAIKKWADAKTNDLGEHKCRQLFFKMLPPQTLFNSHNRMLLLGEHSGLKSILMESFY